MHIYIYIHLFIYIISEYCPSVDVGLYILYLMPRVGWIMLVHYPYWFTSPLWGKLTGKKHCWPSKKTLVARRYHPRKLDICFFSWIFMNIQCVPLKKIFVPGPSLAEKIAAKVSIRIVGFQQISCNLCLFPLNWPLFCFFGWCLGHIHRRSGPWSIGWP